MSVFHFALPRNTFSCARDRSTKTRLRSSSSPSGLYPEHPAPSWPTWWPTTFAFDSVSGGRAGCTRDLGTTSGVLFGTLFRPGQLAGAGSSVGCKFGRWLAAATTCRAANRFTSSWVTMNVPGHWSTRIIEVRCGGGPWFGPCGNDRRTRTPSSSSGCDTAPLCECNDLAST